MSDPNQAAFIPAHERPESDFNRLGASFRNFRRDETGLPDPVNRSLSLAAEAFVTIELLCRMLHNSRLDGDDMDGQPLNGYDEGVLMRGINALCLYASNDLGDVRDWLLARQAR